MSRSGFYRNFYSKEDVLIKHINRIYYDFFHDGNTASKLSDFTSKREFPVARFRFIKENRDFFEALNKSHLVDYAFHQIDKEISYELFIVDEKDELRKKYIIACSMGGTSGTTIEWINSGFKEDEEELAKFFESIIYR